MLNILVLCVQACVIQTVLTQSCGNQYAVPACGYGGAGTGQVGVSGDIGASGTTCVVGSVPLIGSVEFSGCSPSCGSVCISGQCSCDSQPAGTCLASAASTNLFGRGNTVSSSQQSSGLGSQVALSQCNCNQISSPGINSRPSAPSVTPSFPNLAIAPCNQNLPCVSQITPSFSTPCVSQSPPRSTPSVPCNSPAQPRQSSPSNIGAPCACQTSSCVGQSSSRITSPCVSSRPISFNSPSLSASSCSQISSRSFSPAPRTSSGYGGTGTGEVGVSGDIGAYGTTCVVGSVPVCGSVEFSGCSPTCGSVKISGQCECD